MSTPFDGVGIWVLGTRWGGTAITQAEAAAYKAAGVQWAAVKVSDGTTGGGAAVIQDMQACWDGGLAVIPWCFIEPTAGDAGPQMKVCFLASGSGQKLAIADVEAQPQNIAELVAQFGGAQTAVTTWGNPVPTHDGQPSIGQLADIGVAAILPQAYAGAWGVTPAQAISQMVDSYGACGLGAKMPPLLPIGDTGEMVGFAQAAKAAGCQGVSAFRHGANGISPDSFQGVAEVFAPAAPPPDPTPAPVQLTAGTVYLTPKGDRLTLG